jgi:hypothetical protein
MIVRVGEEPTPHPMATARGSTSQPCHCLATASSYPFTSRLLQRGPTVKKLVPAGFRPPYVRNAAMRRWAHHDAQCGSTKTACDRGYARNTDPTGNAMTCLNVWATTHHARIGHNQVYGRPSQRYGA